MALYRGDGRRGAIWGGGEKECDHLPPFYFLCIPFFDAQRDTDARGASQRNHLGAHVSLSPASFRKPNMVGVMRLYFQRKRWRSKEKETKGHQNLGGGRIMG